MRIATKQSLMVLLLLVTACTSCQTKDIGAETDSPIDSTDAVIDPEKVLIVYLSRTNNTRALAQIIHERVGGTLIALELEKPYPADYRTTVDQVVSENASGFLPPLKTQIDNIKKYDVVFVGFPTWDMKLPPPMKSFLSQYDLAGKTVVPFNTNGGYGIGSTFDTVKALCPDSNVLEGYSTKGGVERDGILFVMEGKKEIQVRDQVLDWLKKIKLIQ